MVLNPKDTVKILPIEDSASEGTRAGWARIEVDRANQKSGRYWIAASTLVRSTGRPAMAMNGLSTIPGSESGCPLRRLVTSLHGTQMDRSVPPDIKLALSSMRGFWHIDFNSSKRTSPAAFGKYYVACEVFSDPSKAAMIGLPQGVRDIDGLDISHILAVRIVEVRPERGSDGVERFVPVENYGGFISAWLLGQNAGPVFRVDLGPQLDASTWSIMQ
jgi:hypothetical protein